MSLRSTSVSLIYALVLASFTSVNAGNAGSPAVAAGPLAGIRLAITVDDIPENGDDMPGVSRAQIAEGIVGALKANNAPEIYGFANGNGLTDTPTEIEVYKYWLRAGYVLGNHTYDHLSLDAVSVSKFESNIEKLDRLLDTLSSVSPLIAQRRMFRYPYLEEGNTLKKRDAVRAYLKKHRYQIAEVTTDYNDWAWDAAYIRCSAQHDTKSIDWIKNHIVVNAEENILTQSDLSKALVGRNVDQIVLTHDCALESVMLNKTLAKLQTDGATLVPLGEAMSDPIYRINPNIVTPGGRSFLEQIAESRHVEERAPSEDHYSVAVLNAICAAKPTGAGSSKQK